MQESLPTPQKYQHQGRGHSWCSVLLLFSQKKCIIVEKIGVNFIQPNQVRMDTVSAKRQPEQA